MARALEVAVTVCEARGSATGAAAPAPAPAPVPPKNQAGSQPSSGGAATEAGEGDEPTIHEGSQLLSRGGGVAEWAWGGAAGSAPPLGGAAAADSSAPAASGTSHCVARRCSRCHPDNHPEPCSSGSDSGGGGVGSGSGALRMASYRPAGTGGIGRAGRRCCEVSALN